MENQGWRVMSEGRGRRGQRGMSQKNEKERYRLGM